MAAPFELVVEFPARHFDFRFKDVNSLKKQVLPWHANTPFNCSDANCKQRLERWRVPLSIVMPRRSKAAMFRGFCVARSASAALRPGDSKGGASEPWRPPCFQSCALVSVHTAR